MRSDAHLHSICLANRAVPVSMRPSGLPPEPSPSSSLISKAAPNWHNRVFPQTGGKGTVKSLRRVSWSDSHLTCTSICLANRSAGASVLQGSRTKGGKPGVCHFFLPHLVSLGTPCLGYFSLSHPGARSKQVLMGRLQWRLTAALPESAPVDILRVCSRPNLSPILEAGT
jgi:hypothetical protein